MEWLATSLTRLSLSAAYIDAKFVTYDNAPCYGTGRGHTKRWAASTSVVGGSIAAGTERIGSTQCPIPRSSRPPSRAETTCAIGLASATNWCLAETYSYRTRAQNAPGSKPVCHSAWIWPAQSKRYVANQRWQILGAVLFRQQRPPIMSTTRISRTFGRARGPATQ